MDKYFVLKVTYDTWKGLPTCYTKNRHAGPFNTHQEALMIANAENSARRGSVGKKWIFQVGLEKEIGSAGLIL